MDSIPPRVPMPMVSMSGSYQQPNAAPGLPPWPSGGEGYERLHTGTLYPTQAGVPALIQQPAAGNYSGGPRYPGHTTVMTARLRQKSCATKKRKSHISSDNTSVMCAQGDTTASSVTMMRYIPNSSGFVMPEGMPQTITTLHNPSFLAPQALTSMPSLRNKLSAPLSQRATRQLSYLTHPPLVGVTTSATTSVVPAMPAPTQLPLLTINTSSAMLTKASSSKELCPPTPIPDIPDDLTDADWEIINTTDNFGIRIPNISSNAGHIAKQALVAQPVPPVSQPAVPPVSQPVVSSILQSAVPPVSQPVVPPVSQSVVPPVSQGGVLSPHNNVCSTSYCQQQVSQAIQNQQAVASVSTQELEQTQQPQGVGVLSQTNVLAPNQQVPPQVAERSPSPCQNVSEGHSSSTTATLTHYPVPSSSEPSTSSNRAAVVATSQGCATSNSRTNAQKPDQPLASTSQSQSRSDDDECHTDSCMPNLACSPCSMSPPPIVDESDCLGEQLKLLYQHFHRKRKLTAVLENETDDDNAHMVKNARKDSGRDSDDLVLLACMHSMHSMHSMHMKRQRDIFEALKNLTEGQRVICEQLKNMNEQLHGLSQQVKMESSIKTETQDSCMGTAIMGESSNAIRIEDCCWNDENLLKIKSKHPCKYALKLLEKLFPVEERVGKCYRRGPRSANKPPLDEKRVKILEDCIKYRFGLEEFSACEEELVQKCNQKCLDAKKKVNIKSE